MGAASSRRGLLKVFVAGMGAAAAGSLVPHGVFSQTPRPEPTATPRPSATAESTSARPAATAETTATARPAQSGAAAAAAVGPCTVYGTVCTPGCFYCGGDCYVESPGASCCDGTY